MPTELRILVVEDDDEIRETLADVLGSEGYQVRTAENGQAALESLRAGESLPELIILDLMMPVMSGWDFRAHQQSDPLLAPIPVVILTGDAGVAEKAKALDAAGSLAKPVSLAQLLEVVRTAA
jgi:two-component system chemotaxis response regulator CheY